MKYYNPKIKREGLILGKLFKKEGLVPAKFYASGMVRGWGKFTKGFEISQTARNYESLRVDVRGFNNSIDRLDYLKKIREILKNNHYNYNYQETYEFIDDITLGVKNE